MSRKEIKEHKNTAQKTASQGPELKEQAIKDIEETVKVPEPTAIGDERVAILKHDIYRRGGDDATETVSIDLAVENISDNTIGSVVFEAELYDIECNILGKVEQKTVDFKPGISRTISISYSKSDSDKVRSYCVRVSKIIMTPEPVVIGNEKIKILNHNLSIGNEYYSNSVSGVYFAIRNVSDKTIASLIFEAVFYDIEGDVLDTIKHSETYLKPNTSRAALVQCKQQYVNDVKGYNVRVVKMTTADIERVQLRRHGIRTTDSGEEEVRGIVKNISDVKANAAIVAAFLDSNEENIGTKVVLLRDIEPDETKQFYFLFKPQAGDVVRSYKLNIGDLV